MHSFQDLEFALERCFLKVLGVYDLQPEPTKIAALSDLGEKLEIKFVTSDRLDCADLAYAPPTEAQLQKVVRPLIFELNLYPHEALRRTRIEQIILCSDLLLSGKRAAGTLRVGLHYVDTVFLDVQAFQDDLFGRHTIHHELFHAIDFRDRAYIDKDWRKLQDEDYIYELDTAVQFHIQKGHDPEEIFRPQFDDPYDWLTSRPSSTHGFLTEYAKYSVIEDKAEVFSHMMASYNAVMQRTTKDPVLKRKVEQMKKILLHFCDQFNEDFWQGIANAIRQSPRNCGPSSSM